MNHFIRIPIPMLCMALACAFALVGCGPPPPPAPPVSLPRGGRVQYDGTYTYWDRNKDGKPDRLRHYIGSGAAREYFDDDFNGTWDGVEHVRYGEVATGLKDKREPEGINDMDRESIGRAMTHLIPLKRS